MQCGSQLATWPSSCIEPTQAVPRNAFKSNRRREYALSQPGEVRRQLHRSDIDDIDRTCRLHPQESANASISVRESLGSEALHEGMGRHSGQSVSAGYPPSVRFAGRAGKVANRLANTKLRFHFQKAGNDMSVQRNQLALITASPAGMLVLDFRGLQIGEGVKAWNI